MVSLQPATCIFDLLDRFDQPALRVVALRRARDDREVLIGNLVRVHKTAVAQLLDGEGV